MKWVIACGPCGIDTVVDTPHDKKPDHCPHCGDCDTAVWKDRSKDDSE